MVESMCISKAGNPEGGSVTAMQALALKGAMRAAAAGAACWPSGARVQYSRMLDGFCRNFGISQVCDLPASAYTLAQEWIYSRLTGAPASACPALLLEVASLEGASDRVA